MFVLFYVHRYKVVAEVVEKFTASEVQVIVVVDHSHIELFELGLFELLSGLCWTALKAIKVHAKSLAVH